MNNIISSMPAKPRIKTVTYSKESKKTPGYSWNPGNYAPLRIGCVCPNKKVTILPSILLGGGPSDIGIILSSSAPGVIGQDLFGGVPDGLFILGGTPASNGPVISGNTPGNYGLDLSGGIPGPSFYLGGTPASNGPIISGNSGPDLSGGIPGPSFMFGGSPGSSGPIISGNGPGNSGTNLSGGNI
jgi:hypothetical protein